MDFFTQGHRQGSRTWSGQLRKNTWILSYSLLEGKFALFLVPNVADAASPAANGGCSDPQTLLPLHRPRDLAFYSVLLCTEFITIAHVKFQTVGV